MSLAALAQLVGPSTLLALTLDDSLICVEATRMPAVSVMGW
jgi:hypothetical protein